tara:strand:+ start:1089 stop:1601 length:513 start_codon:yes stop_codon:yes gene_type:complete
MKKIFLTLILSIAILSCETTTEANSDFPTIVDSSQYEEIANAWTNAVNAQDIDLAMSYFSDDAVWAFPNGVQVQGKEKIAGLMQATSSIWTSIENSENTNYLALEGTNEAGEDFKVLLSWGDATYSNDVNSITVPYHNVIFFTDDNKMSFQGGFYDRTQFVQSYDEDPIK